MLICIFTLLAFYIPLQTNVTCIDVPITVQPSRSIEWR